MCMGQRSSYPPPPEIAWAPDMALARKLEEGTESFFVCLIHTPCGTGEFVFYSNNVAIEGNFVTIKFTSEGRRHDFPEEGQRWNLGVLDYEVDRQGQFTQGFLYFDEILSEMPDYFQACPENVSDIAGYTQAMEAAQ